VAALLPLAGALHRARLSIRGPIYPTKTRAPISRKLDAANPLSTPTARWAFCTPPAQEVPLWTICSARYANFKANYDSVLAMPERSWSVCINEFSDRVESELLPMREGDPRAAGGVRHEG